MTSADPEMPEHKELKQLTQTQGRLLCLESVLSFNNNLSVIAYASALLEYGLYVVFHSSPLILDASLFPALEKVKLSQEQVLLF